MLLVLFLQMHSSTARLTAKTLQTQLSDGPLGLGAGQSPQLRIAASSPYWYRRGRRGSCDVQKSMNYNCNTVAGKVMNGRSRISSARYVQKKTMSLLT